MSSTTTTMIPVQVPATIPTPTNISDVVQSVLNNNNNDIIQHRLQTGLGISGGGRGSLTKCTAAVSNLLKQVSSSRSNSNSNSSTGASTITTTAVDDTSTSNDNTNDLETVKDQVAHEILLQQIELLKLAYTVQRNDNEIEVLQQKRKMQMQQQLDNSDNDTNSKSKSNFTNNKKYKTIQELRNEYTLELLRNSCYIEYETIAKIIIKEQPISCTVLNKQIQSFNTQLIDTAQQLDIVTSIEKIRSSQFHFLLTSIQDLKHSISINTNTTTTTGTTSTANNNATGSQDIILQLQDYEKDNTNTNALLATLEKEKLEQQQYFNQNQNQKQSQMEVENTTQT